MIFLPNWRRILRRAWSIRLMALAAMLSGAEIALPIIGDQLPIAPGVLAALSAVTVAGAFVARLMAQKGEDH